MALMVFCNCLIQIHVLLFESSYRTQLGYCLADELLMLYSVASFLVISSMFILLLFFV
uniref:Uncharacterized protein n=1 Tax=Arundo donax TaxID=35708 RepID=A0A0A9HHC1_ARUDO